MNSIDRGFSVAIAASLLSDAPRAGVRLGAALYSGARLLSIGANRYSHSHTASDNGKDFVRSIHAEHSALLKRRHYEDNKTLVLYVARCRADGTRGCSKPCANCLVLCQVAGVRRVRYFDTHGYPQELTL